jgi:2-polyprenyl-3-methyl-5-hydroxy-6-metoxy-1,4-benzoquinol methylase
MTDPGRQQHWESVYRDKGEFQVSWFQESPAVSLDLIRSTGVTPQCSIIDIGGGASRLVDALIAQEFSDITVLDLSEAAVSIAKVRLGERAAAITWIVADVTQWQPQRYYDVWHDRAAFHFLTDANDRMAYVARLTRALQPGAHAVIGTFAADGPERCSGLPVVRYDAERLAETLGGAFALVAARRQDHSTPWGSTQRFQFSVFKRIQEGGPVTPRPALLADRR